MSEPRAGGQWLTNGRGPMAQHFAKQARLRRKRAGSTNKGGRDAA